MSTAQTALAERASNTGQGLSPQDRVRAQIDVIEPGLKAALPPHIPVERFKRVALTAINNNPDLLNADRRSLLNAFQKAAEDALMPDGRDGAVVIYNTKIKNADGRDQWIKAAQWMPMVWGIVKNLRGSGALLTINAHLVYEHDHFEYQLGDDERIDHKPKLDGDRGDVIGGYAIAKLAGGMVEREFMPAKEINEVRAASKSPDKGPWGRWYSEMARKTIIRRLCKRLSLPEPMERLVQRDDGIYEHEGAGAAPYLATRPSRSDYEEIGGPDVAARRRAMRAAAIEQHEREQADGRARAQGMPVDDTEATEAVPVIEAEHPAAVKEAQIISFISKARTRKEVTAYVLAEQGHIDAMPEDAQARIGAAKAERLDELKQPAPQPEGESTILGAG